MSHVTEPTPAIECLLFDMDGVLVDVSRSYRRAVLTTASHFLGKRLEPATVQQYKDRGGYNDDWELTHAIIRDQGVTVSFNDVVQVFQDRYRGTDFDGYILDESPLMNRDTLSKLESLATLGIVTGRPEAEALWTLSHFGWVDAFRIVIAKEHQDGRTKPDPHPLLRALQLLSKNGHQHEAAQTAYVGDTVDDMKAAVAAGIFPVGFVPPYVRRAHHEEVLRHAGALVVVSRCEDLPGLF